MTIRKIKIVNPSEWGSMRQVRVTDLETGEAIKNIKTLRLEADADESQMIVELGVMTEMVYEGFAKFVKLRVWPNGHTEDITNVVYLTFQNDLPESIAEMLYGGKAYYLSSKTTLEPTGARVSLDFFMPAGETDDA